MSSCQQCPHCQEQTIKPYVYEAAEWQKQEARLRAEGAAEERARHQADCERTLLEMEEAATRREREACAKLAESMCRCADYWKPYGRVDPACGAHDTASAILDRGGKP